MTSHQKKILAIAILLMTGFLCGLFIGKTYFPVTKTVTIHDEVIKEVPDAVELTGEAEAHTDTIISYEAKPVDAVTHEPRTDAPDIDVKMGKPELKVKVNGQDVNIKKSEDEKYVFDKGQFKLTQDSVAEFHVTVDPVDETRSYGIGLGVNDGGRKAAIVTAPVSRKAHVDAWAYGDEDSHYAGGLMVRF